ncbi:MAG: hypothetical protein ACLUE1_00075 [Adlercreutzia equolifaciens]
MSSGSISQRPPNWASSLAQGEVAAGAAAAAARARGEPGAAGTSVRTAPTATSIAPMTLSRAAPGATMG